MSTDKDWCRCNSETFWQEVAPNSHVVHIYENQEALLNLLEDFIAGGISAGGSVIVIATKEHLAALEPRLGEGGLNVGGLSAANQYLAFDAEEVLSRFMVNGWPDGGLFVGAITEMFERARGERRPVRVFGEMVALLWAQGNGPATVMLEHHWNALLEKEDFSLFCAYAKDGFSEEAAATLSHICRAHSSMITNDGTSRFDISYVNVF